MWRFVVTFLVVMLLYFIGVILSGIQLIRSADIAFHYGMAIFCAVSATGIHGMIYALYIKSKNG
jgi:uncharacterized membrane protein YqaE (UPF0057 family)